MKKIRSLFGNKLVNEDCEIIQKSLVIAHQYYVSKEKYDEALKISKVIGENQDKDGCFVLTAKKINSKNYNIQWNLQLGITSLLRILWGHFASSIKYNLKNIKKGYS